jgi:predicted RNA binding protein YcfA (HicA-like mRNA interferase family)
MTRKIKLLDRLRNPGSDKSWSFADAEQILLDNGYVLKRIHGSHHVFGNDAKNLDIVLPKHGSAVKPPYIRKIRSQLLP